MSRATATAKAKLSAARATASDWETQAALLAEQLAATRENLGAAALEAGDPVAAARGLTDLRDQSEAARQAAEAAASACVPLQVEALLAEAKDRRADHARLKRDAERHHAKTAELLDAVAEHEQGGEWAHVGRSPISGVVLEAGPRTMEMRQEADRALYAALDLERQAEALGPGPGAHPEATPDSAPDLVPHSGEPRTVIPGRLRDLMRSGMSRREATEKAADELVASKRRRAVE